MTKQEYKQSFSEQMHTGDIASLPRAFDKAITLYQEFADADLELLFAAVQDAKDHPDYDPFVTAMTLAVLEELTNRWLNELDAEPVYPIEPDHYRRFAVVERVLMQLLDNVGIEI